MSRLTVLLALLLLAATPAVAAKQPADATQRYRTRDFSAILMPSSEFIGYIGDGYQRLRIHFTAVERDASHPGVYHVRGTTTVKQNTCDFTGTITVGKITAEGPFTYTPEEGAPVTVKARGQLAASYDFRENPRQSHAGIFTGTMTLDWVIDAQDQLVRDDIDIVSDGYANNQYSGHWSGYAGGAAKTANWGEYRVPGRGDLDCGAGEFMPCKTYRDKGWADYQPQKWQP